MNNQLEYIVREPKTKQKNPPLLVLLHGYGSNEKDLFSFASELPEEFLIVSARAPYEIGFDNYAWYAINFDQPNNRSDIKQAKKALEMISNFIDFIQNKHETNPNKTFLLGFSQGAILSYALSFNFPNKVQYVIALSAYVNLNLISENSSFSMVKTEYFCSHGTVDQVIPIDWAKKAPIFLSQKNLPHVFKEYPVGHGVAPNNFYDFKHWILERI